MISWLDNIKNIFGTANTANKNPGEDVIFGGKFSEYRVKDLILLYDQGDGSGSESGKKSLELDYGRCIFKYITDTAGVSDSRGTDCRGFQDEKEISLEEAIRLLEDAQKPEAAKKAAVFHERIRRFRENARNMLTENCEWYKKRDCFVRKILWISENTSVF